MSKRAAIYARVSSDEQTKGFSIPTQLEKMRQYAEAHGFSVAPEHEFNEDYSAIKLDRPALNKVRELIKQHEIDVLIVYSADRFTRNPVHGPILRDELIDAGVELHFVTRGKFENTPEGEMFAGIEDQFNRYWWAKLREAAMRGRRGKAEAGIIPGSGVLPYGYTKTGKRAEMQLVIEPDEATVVRDMFEWFVQDGLSVKQIAQRLTEQGIPTPGGPRHGNRKGGLCEWHINTITKMLRHEAYAGTFYAYRYRKKKDGTGSVLRPRDEWLPISVPNIVDNAVWEAAQHKLDEGRRKYIRPPVHHYLMSKRVKCTCGHHASARPGYWKDQTYLYYHCNAALQNTRSHRCPMPRFRADYVDAIVWDWVKQLLLDPHALVAGYEESQRTLNQQHEHIHAQIAAIEKQIDKQQHKLSQLLDLYLEGDFTKAVLEQKRTEIETQLAALQDEWQHLVQSIAQTTITDERIQSVVEFAADIRDELSDADFALKRQLVEKLNIHCTLTQEGGEKIVYLHWYAHQERFCTPNRTNNNSASLSACGP